ncbi:MAG: hypothetical protein ACR2Q4_01290 [Geminicoccaceae bacterium]
MKWQQQNAPDTHPNDNLSHRIPVPRPVKIICVGVKFPDRKVEYKDGRAAPANMFLFIRFPRSFIRPLECAPGTAITADFRIFGKIELMFDQMST